MGAILGNNKKWLILINHFTKYKRTERRKLQLYDILVMQTAYNEKPLQ